MQFSFNAYLSVKFRAFGITFGTVTESFTVKYGGGFSFSLGVPVPTSGLTTLYNQRGVLLQVWI